MKPLQYSSVPSKIAFATVSGGILSHWQSDTALQALSCRGFAFLACSLAAHGGSRRRWRSVGGSLTGRPWGRVDGSLSGTGQPQRESASRSASPMSPSCTSTGCASPCEFPYLFNNATNGCASAAALLGDAFTAYNLAYAWAAALLLCGFLRSWLFNLREYNWHFVNRPSVLIPLLCTLLQFLAIIEAINLHSLRWSVGIWASLGCDLFVP